MKKRTALLLAGAALLTLGVLYSAYLALFACCGWGPT